MFTLTIKFIIITACAKHQGFFSLRDWKQFVIFVATSNNQYTLSEIFSKFSKTLTLALCKNILTFESIKTFLNISKAGPHTRNSQAALL